MEGLAGVCCTDVVAVLGAVSRPFRAEFCPSTVAAHFAAQEKYTGAVLGWQVNERQGRGGASKTSVHVT